ncbi:Flagellar biosynthesis protein FlhF [Pelotomaculum sp. FP]|uniref:flagellar biosynthesis protein FlhF n=1 Tax=Pelotomaculum sp. FP TaxID=261474 RepID=UPI0010662B53|nr:flagellar biosynthesis protein FlhF [Pelotomaculum sp. FP]TEB15939.1 Flagellar biosynthesis protein FlhF [Pelotomaculum sp. FP]
MKIKRYVVREMQEAIKLIKEDLGPDALIVSSYKVSAKGFLGFFSPRLLEVTAALDEKPEIKLNMDVPPVPQDGETRNIVHEQIGPSKAQAGTLLAGEPAHNSSRVRTLYLATSEQGAGLAGKELLHAQQEGVTTGPPTESLFIEEAGNRRERETGGLFDTMVSNHLGADLFVDSVHRWRKTLLDMDVQENIVERLLENERHLPDTDYHDLHMNLYKQIANLLAPAYRTRESARVMTFIGPAGVGKTTTLAKLATRFSLNDHKKIALVTVNAYRIGAVEQLNAYGDFLGIPVDVVMTPTELAKVLESHSDKDYIFIDTVGRAARNVGKLLELKAYLDAVEEKQDIFLVLSSATKSQDLNKIACEFQVTGYSKLIFTKIDETETFGPIINLICTLGVPVAYLANGQVVPDDIIEAGPKKMAKLLLRGVDPDEIMAI